VLRVSLRSLLGRKVRLLMSTFAIVLGVSFVVGTLVFSDTLQRSFDSIFASSAGDVVVRPDGQGGGPPGSRTVPGDVVDELAALPGAARADGQVASIGVYVIDTDDRPVGGFGPPALGQGWSDAPAVDGREGLVIVEGRAPEGPEDVVLDTRTADRAGYSLGDTVPIQTPGEQARVEPTLVGLADFADGGSLNGATLAAFDPATAQDLFLGGQDAWTEVWVTAADGVSQDELVEQVREVIDADLEAVTGDEAAESNAADLQEAIGFLETFLLVFAGVALVVGAFLIVNTFSILVAQRSRELALLRALGASRRQVTVSVLVEALVLGVLGGTLGLGLGILLAQALAALFAQAGLDLSGQPLVIAARTPLAAYSAPVQALRDDVALPESSLRRRLVVGLVLAVLGGAALLVGLFGDTAYAGWVVGGGVLAVLLGVTAASPLLSMPLLGAAAALFRRVFGTVGVLAGQNTLRNPRRTAATASALMIGLALAGTMSIAGASASASVDQQIEDSFVGDYVVTNVFGGPFSPSVAEALVDVEGVDRVAVERYDVARLEGDFVFVGAVSGEDLDLLGLELLDGSRPPSGDREVLLAEQVADDADVRPGDTVVLEVPGGEQEWTVAGTYAANPVVPATALVSPEAFSGRAGFADQDRMLVVFGDGTAADVLGERIDEVLADQPTLAAQDQQEYAEVQREPIEQLVLMVFALLGLALVIAVLGIVNTLALSVIERTREVGLLRAVGLGRGQLRRMVTLESVAISVLGAVLGVVLGVLFGVVMMTALRDEGLEVISVPWGQLAVYLVLAVMVGVLAAVLPARRAARLDVLQAIATE
jgi:putative ABC transport system permease protein